MSATKLFSPGPVLVRDDVRKELLHYDICHRSPEFEDMFEDTQKKINAVFQADDSYYSVIVSGSGTSANEAMLSSILREGEGVLLIRNGMFGERLLEILKKHKVPLDEAVFEWGEYPDVNVIEKRMQASSAKVVAMVFHETCTGMINPVYEVGQLCKKYNKTFSVDAVSAAGGEFVDVVKNNIDIVTSVGGKCVGAFPGSAYVCAKESLLAGLTEDQCKTTYLNLYKHYQNAKKTRQTPNTPNLTLFWSLNRALTNIVEEGLAVRIKRCQTCRDIIRAGAEKLGMRLLLQEHLSNTVTSVFLPEGTDANVFLAKMEEKGYTFYIGKGDFAAQNMIQIANMGEIYEEDCYKMLDAVKDCLNNC